MVTQDKHRCSSLSAASQVLRGVLHIFLLCTIFYYRKFLTAGFPLLAEALLQIILSEINRRRQSMRLKQAEGENDSKDLEHLDLKSIWPTPCVGSVVGYREDPLVFQKCLESYHQDFDKALKVLVIGIDGNELEDLEMVKTAESVFGKRLAKLEIKEPFGNLAMSMIRKFEAEAHVLSERSASKKSPALNEARTDELVLGFLISRASQILQENSLLHVPAGVLQPICLYQPHLSKKDIMFTTLIFALAFAGANNIDFIWSSDSDSWIYPDTLHQALGSMVSDESIAGSCTALRIHNHCASVVANVVAATYSTDVALTSGMLSAFDAVDCQSGPCALFRKEPLRAILVAWYTQTFLGQRPMVNEDRHLTTRLLIGGWKVTFNPVAIVATDTPTTFSTWAAQQVRWSRATTIETIAHPGLFLLHSPALFLYTIRRVLYPSIHAYIAFNYALTGRRSSLSSGPDIICRIVLCSLYNLIRNRSSISELSSCLFSQIFLQVPQAAFLFWASITAFETAWGTPMRSSTEKAKGKSRSAFSKNIGLSITVASWLGLVTACVCKNIAYRLSLENETFALGFGFLVAFLGSCYLFVKDI